MNLTYLSTFLNLVLLGTTSLSPLTGDSYTIHFPTHIDLKDTGSFVVSVEGMQESDNLNIKFDDSFVLHDSHGKDDIHGTLSNNNLTFSTDDCGQKIVTYSVDNASVGKWSGQLNVSISLDRVEDNSALIDGPSINKILSSLNPSVITFSHDQINGDYLYDLSVEKDESILLYQNGNEVIITNGKNSPIKTGNDLSKLFYRITNLTTINNLNYLDTSNCTSMSKMFQRSEKLVYIDVSGLNTSGVTDMSYMFENCHGCLEIIGIDDLDYSHVTTFKNFMNDDRVLSVAPNISSWNITSACTDLTAAFKAIGYKTGETGSSIWPSNIDLSNWDVSNVTSLKETLYNTFGIETLNVSNWNTSKVKDMSGFLKMYDSGEESLLTTIIGLEDWDISTATNLSGMFYECINLANADFSNWQPTSATNISNMFYDTYYLDLHVFDDWDQYLNLGSVNISNCFGSYSGYAINGDYKPQWSE